MNKWIASPDEKNIGAIKTIGSVALLIKQRNFPTRPAPLKLNGPFLPA
jgi:hypothetical protein